MDSPDRPLFWVGSALDDLRKFPEGVKRVIGFALRRAQAGGKHADAKPLRGFGGAGVLEVVEQEEGNTYRAVYTVRFAKKSTKGISTPPHEIELVQNRLKWEEEHYRKWQKGRGGEA